MQPWLDSLLDLGRQPTRRQPTRRQPARRQPIRGQPTVDNRRDDNRRDDDRCSDDERQCYNDYAREVNAIITAHDYSNDDDNYFGFHGDSYSGGYQVDTVEEHKYYDRWIYRECLKQVLLLGIYLMNAVGFITIVYGAALFIKGCAFMIYTRAVVRSGRACRDAGVQVGDGLVGGVERFTEPAVPPAAEAQRAQSMVPRSPLDQRPVVSVPPRVFVTPHGERFHMSSSCRGLYRASATSQRTPCLLCARQTDVRGGV